MRALGRILKLSLALTLALPGPVFAGEPALTSEQIAAASEFRQAARSPLARLGLTPANITSRAANVGKVTGQFANEVIQFQALLIMLGVAQYQMVKQAKEMERLSHGLTNPAIPENGDLKELCASRPQSNASEDMLCSGEFLVGLAAGAGLLTGSVIVKNILKLFVTAKNRSALLNVLGSIGSMSVMVVGGTAASMVWTEAVKLLPDAKQIEGAHGIAGRAALAWRAGTWNLFINSPDGALWNKINEKVYEILVVDSELRSTWMTNVLRFGMRGELITSLGVLMGAASAGTVIASGAVGLATAGGVIAAGGTVAALSSTVLAFVIGAALGFVALDVIFETNTPQYINRLIQNLRSWSSENALASNAMALKLSAMRFRPVHYPNAGSESYINAYLGLFNLQFKERARLRSSAATVAIEKLYELRLELEATKKKLAITEAALKSANIQANLYVEVDGKILSFQEAREKLCKDNRANCITETIYQIQRFRDLKSALDEGTQASLDGARAIIELFNRDSKMVAGLSDSANYIYPMELSARLSEEKARTDLLAQYFKFIFGAAFPEAAHIWPTNPRDQEQARQDRLKTLQDIAEHYQLTFLEDKVVASLKGGS